MKNVTKLMTAGMMSLMAIASIAPSFANNGWREQRFDNRHPRRSEVLDRSNNLNRRITADRGNLDGHYGQLKRQDAAIRQQEQRMAQRNDGHITRGEQAKLNREENRLANRVQNYSH